MQKNEWRERAVHGRERRLRRGVGRVGLVAGLAALGGLNWAGWMRYGGGAAHVAAAPIAHAPLRVAAVLPTLGVDEAARLSIVFDAPLLAASAPVARPSAFRHGGDAEPSTDPAPFAADDAPERSALPALTIVPFTSDPPLEGRWRWGAPDRLDFELAHPLGMGLAVTMQPTAALEALAGRPLQAGVPLRWETGSLRVSAVETRSVEPSAFTVDLVFNAPVEATALAVAIGCEVTTCPPRACAASRAALTSASALASASGGASASGSASAPKPRLATTLLTVGAKSRHSARVELGEHHHLTDGPLHVEMIVAGDLAPARGNLGLVGENRRTLEVPRSFAVLGCSARSASDWTASNIEVRFDRALDTAQEAPPVTVEPTVAPLTVRIERNSVILEGAFACRTTYRVHVGESLLAASGETLRASRTLEVTVPARDLRLELDEDAGILTPGGGLTLGLSTTNIATVVVSASKVLPGNLVPHLRGEGDHYTSNQITERVFELEGALDVPVRHALDLRALLGAAEEDVRGVYRIDVKTPGRWWERDATLLRVTDLAPTVKVDASGYHVWVRSFTTGAPVANAEVAALTVKDQLLGSARTDAEGYAALPVVGEGDDARAYVVTVEHEGDMGFAELTGPSWSAPRELTEGRANPRIADVCVYSERRLYRPGDTVHLSGIARTPEGQVWTKPLEVRVEGPDGKELLSGRVAPDLAQGTFHIDVPTGHDARTGTCSVEVFALDEGQAKRRGHPVGRTSFGVEAFLAARLVVETLEDDALQTSADGIAATPGAVPTPQCGAVARALAGTSVEGFPVTATAVWRPTTYRSSRYSAFEFRRAGAPRSRSRAAWTGALDARGEARIAAPGTDELGDGAWTGAIDWTVREPGGRSATAGATLAFDRSPLHLGLALGAVPAETDATLAVEANEAGPPDVFSAGALFDARWVAVDFADAPAAPTRVGWELVRVVREPRLETVGGHLVWSHVESTVVLATGAFTTTPEGAGSFPVTVPEPGLLRLSLRAADGPSVARTFHSVHGDPRRFVPPLEALEAVLLTPTVSTALPGTELDVDVRAPFDGELLVTVEDSRLRSQVRGRVIDGQARVRVAIPTDARGGVFLSAQVIRPLERRAAWRPHRAHGWTRVSTLHEHHALNVELDAPEVVRPGGRATVRVSLAADDAALRTPRPAAVHLFAVDEGIRVTGGDRLVSPGGHFFASRALSTRTTDSWFSLLPDLELPPEIRRIGGDTDGGTGAARQRAPERVHRVPGVVWSTFVEFGDDDTHVVEVTVPDFVGTLTWMAIAVDGDSYGSAEARSFLRGDMPLAAEFPRFVAPGDRFVVPVRFDNVASLGAEVTLELELSGPVRFVHERAPSSFSSEVEPETQPTPLEASSPIARGGAPEPLVSSTEVRTVWRTATTLGVQPGSRGERWLELEATAPTGARGTGRIAGRLRLSGAFEDGRAIEEAVQIDLPVRSGRPIVIASLVRMLPAGTEASIDVLRELGLDVESEAPERGVANAHVKLAPTLEAGLEPIGRYLLEYPYGCAEQTSSRILALLAAPRASWIGDGELDDAAFAASVESRVRAGLDRLWAMKVPGGGIGYWMGAQSASTWATVYVGETLHACREAGYGLPEELVDGVARHLEHELRGAATLAERASLLRVLAGLGRPQPGWSKRLFEERAHLGRPELLELAFAALLNDERDDAETLLGAAMNAVEAEFVEGAQDRRQRVSSRLASSVRCLALELRVRLQLDATDPEIARLVSALNAERDEGEWGGRFANTIDNAAALLALKRFQDLYAAQPNEWKGTLTHAGVEYAVDSTIEVVLSLDPRQPFTFQAQGAGSAWLSATLEGRRAESAVAVDRGLVVRRRWLDAAGYEISPGAGQDWIEVPLGSLVTVELTLATDGREAVDEVVVVDALPGGFEVENPRLANTAQRLDDDSTALRRRALEPDRVEFLDDRVLVFGAARAEAGVVRYHLRAVALGEFERAAVHAEAMYSPELRSSGGPSERVTVR